MNARMAYRSRAKTSLPLEGEGRVGVSSFGDYSRPPIPLTLTLSPPGRGN
jgi:hypothetical protein